MKKKMIILISILIVIATVLFYFITRKKTQEITLVTANAHYGYIAKSVTATGTVQPLDTVSVGAQVSGVIKNIYVDFNSMVKKGQLLAQIDPAIIMAQTEQSKANLANAKSNLTFQQSTFERQKQLFNLGAISKADYQLAQNQYNSALAAVDNANAQLKIATRNLFYTNIYSPIDGVVLNRNVNAGQTIASSFNAPTLFVIAKDLTKMQVRASVDEADVGGVKPGQKVAFTVDAFPDDTFQGTVQEVLLHPSVTANVVTYKTLINVENVQMKLKPGMTASSIIYTEEDPNALLIPSRALNFKPDSAVVSHFVIVKGERGKKAFDKGGKKKYNSSQEDVGQSKQIASVWIKKGDTLLEKRIIIGINDEAFVKVAQGLSPKDEVVTNTSSNKNATDVSNAQRSPFVPQRRRRSSGSPRN